MQIKITHQQDKTLHRFNVKNSDKLTAEEVKRICYKMGVKALFINGNIIRFKAYGVLLLTFKSMT